jgi:predicted nucleic acid-binding protein
MDFAVVIDSSVFIKHWRSKNRTDTLLSALFQQRKAYVSAVAKYEVLVGVSERDMYEWHQIFEYVTVLPFDEAAIDMARIIFRQLKQENRMISLGDILIAATAMANDLPLSTLNRNHFERIRGLRIV